MGWTFCWEMRSRQAMLTYLRRSTRLVDHWEVLKSTAVGNNHWYLYRNKETGRVSIGLDLMAGGGKDGWGYKDLSEDFGPGQVNCPLSYLDQASEAVGYAVEWRQKVRAFHALKAERPTLVAGLRIIYGEAEFKLLKSAGPRRGWNVERISDGRQFRMKAVQLARSQVVTQEAVQSETVSATDPLLAPQLAMAFT